MKKVLVIGYVWPEPNSSAAGRHMLSILRQFIAQGWQVTFASPAQDSAHAIDLEAEGIKRQNIVLNCNSFDDYLLRDQPDIVLFDRFMMEEQFGWRVDQHSPQALKILDTEDLQCLRHARHLAHKAGRALTDDDLTCELAKREIAAIWRCDLSLIISSYEMALLRNTFQVAPAQLLHLPFMVDLDKIPQQSLPFSQRQHVMTIGNFRHAPNWDAVQYLQALWPEIKKQLPDIELHIYGAYPPPKATALHNKRRGFLIKGWAHDAWETMGRARLCLAPLRFGAGIKGKLLDALITGTPSITTRIGAEAMQTQAPWPGLIADSDAQFIDAVVTLYQDQAQWNAAAARAKTQLESQYDQSKIAPQLIDKITDLLQNLPEHRRANFTGSMLKHHTMMSTKYLSKWITEKNK